MGIALEDTARLSSLLLLLLLKSELMSARYFLTLTSLDSKYIQVRKEIDGEGYTAGVATDLVMVTQSYVQHMNHLMVMENAAHTQIRVVIVFPKKVARTDSLTRRVKNSQSRN